RSPRENKAVAVVEVDRLNHRIHGLGVGNTTARQYRRRKNRCRVRSASRLNVTQLTGRCVRAAGNLVVSVGDETSTARTLNGAATATLGSDVPDNSRPVSVLTTSLTFHL